ncbi:unnamed protein product [Diamesa hyperborea]
MKQSLCLFTIIAFVSFTSAQIDDKIENPAKNVPTDFNVQTEEYNEMMYTDDVFINSTTKPTEVPSTTVDPPTTVVPSTTKPTNRTTPIPKPTKPTPKPTTPAPTPTTPAPTPTTPAPETTTPSNNVTTTPSNNVTTTASPKPTPTPSDFDSFSFFGK